MKYLDNFTCREIKRYFDSDNSYRKLLHAMTPEEIVKANIVYLTNKSDYWWSKCTREYKKKLTKRYKYSKSYSSLNKTEILMIFNYEFPNK